jgi:hypothetical protein
MSIFQSAIDPSYKQYTIANVYVNGSLLLEESAVSIDRVTESHSIYTLGKGYAGEAAGAPMIELSVENAVPSTNFELDSGRFMGVMQQVSFAVNAGSKVLQFNGFIVADNFAHAVNSNAKLAFKCKGFMADWE